MFYFRRLGLIVLLSLSSGLPIEATTLVAMPLAQLAQNAPLIVEVEIGPSHVAPINGNPFTLVEVAVKEAIRGKFTNPIIVAIPGGILANTPVPIQVEIPGAPRLFPGVRAILFLEEIPGNPEFHHLVGLSQGVFYLSEDGSTARQNLDGAHLVAPAVTGNAPTERSNPWPVDALKAEIRTALREVTR